jgi:PAS domain S-box-containing protein
MAESADRFANIIHTAMDAVISIDADQRIVVFNPAAEKMFGCPMADAIGSAIDLFIPARFRQKHAEHVQSFSAAGATVRSMGALGEIWGVRRTGEEFPIEASISQSIDHNGRCLMTVIMRDATKRRPPPSDDAELLLRDLSHRIKNLFAIVGAFAHMTAKNSPDLISFQQTFSERLKSLAALTQMQLSANASWVRVGELISTQLASFVPVNDRHVRLSGPVVLLAPVATQYVGLALHELATNAIKYGALSQEGARIDVNWRVFGGEQQHLGLVWRESGVGQFTTATRLGFGRTLLETIVPSAVGGRAQLRFRPNGIAWRLRLPSRLFRLE